MIGILLLSLIISANCNCNNIIKMCDEIKRNNKCDSTNEIEELSRILLNDEELSYSYNHKKNTPVAQEDKDLSYRPFISHSIILLLIHQL